MIEPIDHVERGLERVTSYFKDKEDYLKLLQIFLEELQDVSDQLMNLSYVKDLSTVTGIWLDYLGKIIGESRDGRSDEAYRKALQLRVAINTSDGTAPVMYEIIKTFTESDRVRIAEGILSFGQVIFDGTVNADLSLWALVQEIQPVTVKTIIVQDTENKSAFPAWEITTSLVEVFEVFDGVVSEPLELVLSDLSPPVQFFVSTTGIEGTYDQDTVGREVLEWEEAVPFRIHTGEYLELVISEGVVEQFYVNGTDESVKNDTLLPWEIDDTTNISDAKTPEQEELEDYYGEELPEVLSELDTVIENLPEYP